MKQFLFTLVFVFSLLPTFAFSQMDTTFTIDIDAGSGVDNYAIEFNYYNSTDVVARVTYKRVSSGEVHTIDMTSDDYVHYLEFEDYNFDGKLDMYAHDPCMILGNCFGKVYLFKDGEFKHDPQFDNMTTVMADAKNKTIFSSNRSAAGSIFTNETFKWDGEKLTLIKRISQDYAPGEESQMYEYVIEELNSEGKLVVTKKELLQEPNLE